MAATIKDIAQRTGLGLATISKYLNGGHVKPANPENENIVLPEDIK